MSSFRKSLPLLLAAVLTAGAASRARPESTDPSREVFQEIGRILGELAEISGLRVRHKVAYDLISRANVKRFLEQRVEEAVTPEEVRAEEITLKLFGLVPQNFDLRSSTVDLLTEQAAAFYDFRKKKLYITDWTPSATREPALVHELAHALADQNFNLAKYMRQGQKSDDGAMARMAVMEGQASWLMSEYLVRRSGQSLATSPELLERMSRRMDPASSEYPVFAGSPLYLRETLLFPYTGGMRFQNSVFQKLGKEGFAEVFRRPPLSTRQILHPEAYFTSEQPQQPKLPEAADQLRGYRRLAEGSIGELDHSILLEQYAGNAASAEVAPNWRGGQYAIYERRSPPRQVLAYASAWADEASAKRFFGLYQEVLRKKWAHLKIQSEAAGRVSGSGDNGYFELRRDSATITSLEGLERPAGPVR